MVRFCEKCGKLLNPSLKGDVHSFKCQCGATVFLTDEDINSYASINREEPSAEEESFILCKCGQRFLSEEDFMAHGKTCSKMIPELMPKQSFNKIPTKPLEKELDLDERFRKTQQKFKERNLESGSEKSITKENESVDILTTNSASQNNKKIPKTFVELIPENKVNNKPLTIPKSKAKLKPKEIIDGKIDEWIDRLIDLSRRNRQLYFKPTKLSTIKLIRPSTSEIYDKIVNNSTAMTIIYRDIENLNKTKKDLSEFIDDSLEKNPLDYKKPLNLGEILTDKEDKELYKALKNLLQRSKTSFEEQGVNILYLAFGFLEWKEIAYSDQKNFSPLFLVPVLLIRESLLKPYKIQFSEDDIILNPALSVKLEKDFKIILPEFDDDIDNIEDAFAQIGDVLENYSEAKSWRIVRETFLGFFTFSKFMMYKELDENRNLIYDHKILNDLILEKVNEYPQSLTGDQLDDIPPQDVYHVLDADSSQQNAIIAAENGSTFSLQGPPGTGKSQTIANIIASFLVKGKSALFVSEKSAALEVVMKRLEECNLDEFCLSLHSYKENKKTVINELGRYLIDKEPCVEQSLNFLNELQKDRTKLNDYFKAIIKPHPPFNISAYKVHGKLLEFKDISYVPDFNINIQEITKSKYSTIVNLFRNITSMRSVFNQYYENPWYGFDIQNLTFEFRTNATNFFENIVITIEEMKSFSQIISEKLSIKEALNFNQINKFFEYTEKKRIDFLLFDLKLIGERFNTIYKSFLRTFKSSYKKDVKKIQNVLNVQEKLKYFDCLNVIKEGLDLKELIKIPNVLTWEEIDAKMLWNTKIEIPSDFRTQLENTISKYKEDLNMLRSLFPALDSLNFKQRVEEVDFETMINWLNKKVSNLDDIDDWERIENIKLNFKENQCEFLFDIALKNESKISNLEETFEKFFYVKYLDHIYSKEKILAQFNSTTYSKTWDDFKKLDKKQVQTTNKRIISTLRTLRPTGQWVQAQSSEQNILKKEIFKKRRVKPIRMLFKEIPNLVKMIKPCFLMSPLSISKYLDPHVFKFDIVLFDEASQIRPEDAIGAMMRGSQVIIVGDRHQLPPTSFFQTSSDDYEEDDYESIDFDSILDLFSTSKFPDKMLNYHYRSRDESLIAFSNYNFYDNKLLTFPGPSFTRADIGITFEYVQNGIYDKGKSRRNTNEARKVANLALEHFKTKPDLSLGIITFSQAQQEAIDGEIEKIVRNNLEYEPYFNSKGLDSFFVKNLENVQGDERDVLFFSIGYGKDIDGKLSMNFGPLNKVGGERRLNVAITRAKYAIKIVSSIHSSEIDLTHTKSEGIRLLKQYLEYAESGGELSYIRGRETSFNSEFDSPFEKQVYSELSKLGYTVHTQVGCSGYKIDLAIVHPEYRGKYILGIECDGSLYHSSFTARDRDRIRQDFLEELGWTIYRIWSRDWVLNADKELNKIKALVENLKSSKPIPLIKKKTTTPNQKKREITTEDFENELENTGKKIDFDKLPKDFKPYKQCTSRYKNFFVDVNYNTRGTISYLENRVRPIVKEIVMEESPVHINELCNRISSCLSISRLGPKMREIIIDSISGCNGIRKKGDIVWKNDQTRVPVRFQNFEESKRKLVEIALEEIAQGILYILRDSISLVKDDILLYVAKIFGGSSSSNNNEHMLKALHYLSNSDYIIEKDEKYMLKNRDNVNINL